MSIVTIESEAIRQLKKFELKCDNCGSNNCEFWVDWAAYPSASWCNYGVVCKDCHEDETIYESY